MIPAMVSYSVQAFDAAAWRTVLAQLADPSLPQTWNYGAAKVATGPWRIEHGILEQDGRTVGAAQVLIRDLPAGLPGGLAWISRGPLWRQDSSADNADRLNAALAALARHYAGQRGYYLRMAPPAPDGLALAAGPIDVTPISGWASARVDLSRPLADLRAGLVQKWRNAANKAERSGVSVNVTPLVGGNDCPPFTAFLSDYADLLAERAIATTVTPELLQSLAELSGPDEGLTLLGADQDGKNIGWTLIARFGDTAEYLAGVVGKAGRDAGAGQHLLWCAVAAMQEAGCQRFDLGGLDPEMTPAGIRRFKQGLGGIPYRLMNEVEALPSGPVAGVMGRLVRWRVNRARTE